MRPVCNSLLLLPADAPVNANNQPPVPASTPSAAQGKGGGSKGTAKASGGASSSCSVGGKAAAVPGGGDAGAEAHSKMQAFRAGGSLPCRNILHHPCLPWIAQ